MNPPDKDTLALVARRVPVEMHHHHAVQMVVSLDHPYTAILDGQHYENVQGFLIDANIPHACQCIASTVMVISVDAATSKGKTLRQCLQGETFRLLEPLVSEANLQEFRAAYWQSQSSPTAGFDPLALIYRLSDISSPCAEPDPRVAEAMEYVARNIERPLRLTAIAEAVSLSESRLRHLFVKDTGIPLSNYILWSRMKAALYNLVHHGSTLSEAAHEAGYADHAHFTRTFRQMFGVSPSLLLKYSDFLSVFDIP